MSKVCHYCDSMVDDSDIISSANGERICKSCISLLYDIVKVHNTDKKESVVENRQIDMTKYTPKKIVEYLDEYVIGQDKVKKTIAVAVYNHYLRIQKEENVDDFGKSNILMIGPTGCGKTHIAQSIAKLLHLPIVIADATTFTSAGYVGDDVKSLVFRLIDKAGGDISLAEKGIIFFDEVDKIAKKESAGTRNKDIGGEGVQQGLLKMLEGTEITLPENYVKDDKKVFDTKNVLFICSGAFVGLINKEEEKKSIGFFEQCLTSSADKEQKITPSLLTEYGMIPEFIGRLPIITTLNELSEEDIELIFIKPKNSVYNQFNRIFKLHDIELEFSQELIKKIAQTAIKNKTGARGLRSVVEQVVEDALYEVPDLIDVKKVIINDIDTKPIFE